MEDKKDLINVDTRNIDKLISDIDSKINELEQKELEGKPFELQEELKQKWENERKRIQEESQKKFEKQQKKLEEKYKNNPQVELQSIDDMKKDMAELRQQIEDDYNKTMEEVLSALMKNIKTDEDRKVYEEISKIFKNDSK